LADNLGEKVFCVFHSNCRHERSKCIDISPQKKVFRPVALAFVRVDFLGVLGKKLCNNLIDQKSLEFLLELDLVTGANFLIPKQFSANIIELRAIFWTQKRNARQKGGDLGLLDVFARGLRLLVGFNDGKGCTLLFFRHDCY